MHRTARLAAAIVGVILIFGVVIGVGIGVVLSNTNSGNSQPTLGPNPSSVARINNEYNEGFNGQTSVGSNGSYGG